MSAAIGLLAVLVVLVVPGVLLAVVLGWRLDGLTTWAAIPVLSVGVNFVLAEFTTVSRVRFGVWSFAVLFIALVLALVARQFRQGSGQPSGSRGCVAAETRVEPNPSGSGNARAGGGSPRDVIAIRLQERLSLGLLAAGVLLGLSIFVHGMHGLAVVPPQQDGANHGFFVARIMHIGSIDPSKVVVTDPGGATKVARYYPLGMHATAAIAAEIAPTTTGRILVDLTVVLAAVVLPVGMFALARFLIPDRALVAGLTACLTPMLALLAYPSMQFGVLALLVGMAMVPISAVLVTRGLLVARPARRSAWLRALVPASLAIVAVTATHPSETPTLLLIVAALLGTQPLRAVRGVTTLAAPAAVLAVISVVMLAPTLAPIASGSTERSSYDPFATSKPLAVSTTLTRTVELANASVTFGDDRRARQHLPNAPHTQVIFGLLAVIGAAICLRRHLSTFVIAWGIVIALTVIAYSSNGTLSRTLTSPWYRQGYRLAMNQAFFAPFFAAVALEAVLMGLAHRAHSRHNLLLATGVASTIAVVTLGVQGVHQADATNAFTFNSPLMKAIPAAEQAFNWLHAHQTPNDTVINDPSLTDSSAWMYADANVAPLFAAHAGDGNIALALAMRTPDLVARDDLVVHVGVLGRDARIDALACHYHARWIYYETQGTILIGDRVLRLQQLRTNPHIHQVFQRDGIYVFRITATPCR